MNKQMITIDLLLPDMTNFSTEESKQIKDNFFIQLQGFLMGAAICTPSNVDIKVKINDEQMINQIALPDAVKSAIQQKNNTISVVNVNSGNGVVFQ